MKKLLLVLTVIAGTNFSVSAQSLSQGSIVADVYYGFPNLYKTVLETAYSDNGDDFAIGGYGPVGVRGEYLVSEKLGVGVDFMLNKTTVTYNYSGFDSDNNAVIYEDEISTTKWGLMATLNYHIINNDRLDFCFTAGAGYKNRSWKYESTKAPRNLRKHGRGHWPRPTGAWSVPTVGFFVSPRACLISGLFIGLPR